MPSILTEDLYDPASRCPDVSECPRAHGKTPPGSTHRSSKISDAPEEDSYDPRLPEELED